MDRSQKGYLILLMFFSPILGLIATLKSKNEKTLLFFGILFFGLAGSTYVYRPGSDGESHLMNAIYNYTGMQFSEFVAQFYDLITFASSVNTKDLYLHCISFLSVSIFETPELIHVFAGLILGYFFTKSALLVLKNKINVKKSGILVAFIVLFLFDRSLGALNSIRMWTGMWVFFYGTYSYALTKEKKYIAVILFSIFVHFSYIVILIPFIISYLLRKRTIALSVFYIISFGLSLSFASIGDLIPKTNLVETQQKSNVIDSEEKAEFFQEKAAIASQVQHNFYITYGEGFYSKYSIVGLSIILLFFFNNKKTDSDFNFLFASGISLYSFSNIVTFSPSLAGRVKTIASLFIVVATIQLLFKINSYKLSQQKMKLFNFGLVVFLLSSIPMFLFQLSYLIQMLSFFTLFLPEVSWILGDKDNSIREVLSIIF